jgi:4-hydroxythreonine-4-phosphate dehydrogenase
VSDSDQAGVAGRQESRPLVAITMGDPAGIGPEIIVKALSDPAVTEICRTVVIGDAGRLEQAAAICGLPLEIARISEPEQAKGRPGTADCIDLALVSSDLPFGKLSEAGGEAAYQAVRRAAALAVEHRVDAICTAPLNKEALHLAGHIYPGHTEMLADLTGTEEVSMMLVSPRVRVIHVTTHIGLIDMVERVEPGLVYRTIKRGHEALVRAGIRDPRIAVCGINPHAGEHGLFGRGEEEQKVAPGVERAQADGIDAQGPLPADTVFFRAGRGDFDLVVAMYHDQGHGPVKVLGLEAGVNITVGLPVIRTSVDHGTAFDIAGTGQADHLSLIEALRQAAQLAAARD